MDGVKHEIDDLIAQADVSKITLDSVAIGIAEHVATCKSKEEVNYILQCSYHVLSACQQRLMELRKENAETKN